MAEDNGKSGPSQGRLRDAAALTLMESPAFRVRMGAANARQTTASRAFIGRIKALVRKHGAGPGGRSGRVSAFGRGVGAAAYVRVRSAPQRVTVKALVVRHAKYRGAAGASSAIGNHVRYIGRSGAARADGEGGLFDESKDLSREEAVKLKDRIAPDRHHFRFIVSPESGSDLDLKSYGGELVAAMERDLGTKLEWVAAAHYDTDNPHLHLLVRGKDDRGGDLVMSRDYISHGVRLQAMEIATQHLGPRLPHEIEKSLIKDLTADRVTGVDFKLAEARDSHETGFVSALERNDGSLATERQRVAMLTRLQHLESLGLAEEIRSGIWRPDVDLIARLRDLSTRNDTIKLMHERMRHTDPSITTVIYDKAHPPTEPRIGRVYARGQANELSDAEYLLIEADDGKAYYVPLGRYSEAADERAVVGAIVQVTAVKKRVSGVADRNLMRFARANNGIYDPDDHAREISARAPPGLDPAEYLEAHLRRARALASRGILEELPGERFRVPQDFVDQLQRLNQPARDAGDIIRVEQLSRGLEGETETLGVTWMDRLLARRSSQGVARGGFSRFERDLREVLERRLGYLTKLGLTERDTTGVRLRATFLDELYEREIKVAARGLEARYGHHRASRLGEPIYGTVESIERLPSGDHALIVRNDSFTLVPAGLELKRSLGKAVTLRPRQGRVPTLDEPRAFSLTFSVTELVRHRGLSR